MAKIFVSFAKEDIRYRDFLIGQMNRRGAPFSFMDMSLQEPFDDKGKPGTDGTFPIF